MSLLAIPLSAQTSKLAQVKVTGSVKFPEAQIAAADRKSVV